jgi:hypothetical protein
VKSTTRYWWQRKRRSAAVPSYLLPPRVAEVVFDPLLRRAGDIVQNS